MSYINKVNRNPDGKLTYIQYGGPIDENPEPEHLIEVEDAIVRALEKGWNPTDETDKVCRYSFFLWHCVEYSYLHKTADRIQEEGS